MHRVTVHVHAHDRGRLLLPPHRPTIIARAVATATAGDRTTTTKTIDMGHRYQRRRHHITTITITGHRHLRTPRRIHHHRHLQQPLRCRRHRLRLRVIGTTATAAHTTPIARDTPKSTFAVTVSEIASEIASATETTTVEATTTIASPKGGHRQSTATAAHRIPTTRTRARASPTGTDTVAAAATAAATIPTHRHLDTLERSPHQARRPALEGSRRSCGASSDRHSPKRKQLAQRVLPYTSQSVHASSSSSSPLMLALSPWITSSPPQFQPAWCHRLDHRRHHTTVTATVAAVIQSQMSYTTVTRSALHLMNYPTIQSSLSYFLVNRTRSPRVLAHSGWPSFIGSLVHWFTRTLVHSAGKIRSCASVDHLVQGSIASCHTQTTHALTYVPVIEQEAYRVYSSADT